MITLEIAWLKIWFVKLLWELPELWNGFKTSTVLCFEKSLAFKFVCSVQANEIALQCAPVIWNFHKRSASSKRNFSFSF